MSNGPIDGTGLTDEVVDRAVLDKKYLPGDGYQTTDLLWQAIGDFRKVSGEQFRKEFERIIKEHSLPDEIKEGLFRLLNNF